MILDSYEDLFISVPDFPSTLVVEEGFQFSIVSAGERARNTPPEPQSSFDTISIFFVLPANSKDGG